MIIAPVLSIVYYGQLYYSKANTLFVDGKECQRSSFIIHRIICHNRYIILCGITELEILYVLRCKMLDEWKRRKGACGKYIAKKERDKYQSWFLLKHSVPKHRWIVRPKAIKNTSGVHTSALLGEISVNGRILDALIAFNSLYILSDRFLYKNQRKIFIFSECITAGKLVKKVFNTQDMPDCMAYYENQSKQRTLPITAIIGTVDGRVITNGFDRKLFDGIVTHISCFKNYVLACSEDRTIVLIKNWTDVDILHVELRGSVYQCGLRGFNNYFAFTECGNVFFNGDKFTFPYKSVCSATFYRGTVLVGLKNGGIMMCKKREFACLNTNRTFSSGQDFFLLNEKQHIVRNNVVLYDLSGVKEKIEDFYLKPRIMALRFKDKVWLLWSVPKKAYERKIDSYERTNRCQEDCSKNVSAIGRVTDRSKEKKLKIREVFVREEKYSEHKYESTHKELCYTLNGKNTRTGLCCSVEDVIGTRLGKKNEEGGIGIRRISLNELEKMSLNEYFMSALEIKIKSGSFIISLDDYHCKIALYDRIIHYNMENELVIHHYRKITSLSKDVYGCRTGILFYKNTLLKISSDAITGIIENNGFIVMCSRDGYVYFLDKVSRIIYRKFIDNVFLEGIYVHNGRIITCGFRSSEFVVYSFITETSIHVGVRPKKWSFSGTLFSYVRQSATFLTLIDFKSEYINDNCILSNGVINCSCFFNDFQFLGDFEGNVFVLRNYTLIDRIRLNGEVNDIKATKNGTSIFLYCCTNNSFVYKILFVDGLLLEERSLRLKNRILSITVDKYVYVSSSNGLVYKLSANLVVLQSSSTDVLNFSVICVNTNILLGGTDGFIRVMNQNLDLIQKLKVHNNTIFKIACRDQKLYTVGDDHTLRITDIACNEVLNKKIVGNSPIIDVRMSADRIYILCKDKHLVVVDYNLEILYSYKLYLGVVNSFEILKDRLLILGEGIQTIFLSNMK